MHNYLYHEESTPAYGDLVFPETASVQPGEYFTRPLTDKFHTSYMNMYVPKHALWRFFPYYKGLMDA